MEQIQSTLPTGHLELDEDGFLINPSMWTPSVAEYLARIDGIRELTDTHWKLIDSLRDFYFSHGYAPQERHVCLLQHLDKYCLEDLFNNQYREAWRLAGLPNPGEEYKSYM